MVHSALLPWVRALPVAACPRGTHVPDGRPQSPAPAAHGSARAVLSCPRGPAPPASRTGVACSRVPVSPDGPQSLLGRGLGLGSLAGHQPHTAAAVEEVLHVEGPFVAHAEPQFRPGQPAHDRLQE